MVTLSISRRSRSTSHPWLSVGLVALGALSIATISILISSFGEPSPRLRSPAPGTPWKLSLLRGGVQPWMWVAGAASTPLLRFALLRLPVGRWHWFGSLPLFGLFFLLLAYLTSCLFFSIGSGTLVTAPLLPQQLFAWTLPCWLLFALLSSLENQRRARTRHLEAVQLRVQLSETRLQAITAKLNPHFLFNTLQGISTLIYRDPRRADAMLRELSALLRLTLRRGEKLHHSLGEELELLESYANISRQRFGDRLKIDFRIDEETRKAEVPFFVLQPLVENAIEHGIANRAAPGNITIYAAQSGDQLLFGVRDDGPGLSTSTSQEEVGLGLDGLRGQLRELYGSEAHLELIPRHPHGVDAALRIPLRLEGENR